MATLKEKNEALVDALADANKKVKALEGRLKMAFTLLEEFGNFSPECCLSDTMMKEIADYAYDGDVADAKADMEGAPFISETYLYNLIGKEDARSVLGRFRRIKDALEGD